MQMVQRPHWRRRAAESGVIESLLPLLRREVLTARPRGLQTDAEDLLPGYNLLLQVLLTLNWCARRMGPRASVEAVRVGRGAEDATTAQQSLRPVSLTHPAHPRIMFDEVAEAQLRRTDLASRLRSAINGPDRWIALSLPRAVARNLLYKLEHPAARPHLGTGLQRVRGELREFWDAFPELPERWSSAAHSSGLRGDDHMVRKGGQGTTAHLTPLAATPLF